MNILLINPAIQNNFWTFRPTLELTGRKAQDLPLGMLTVAALLPQEYPLHFVDARTRSLTEADWDFAEVVFLGGLLYQVGHLAELIGEARRRGKYVVVGGSSVYHIPERTLETGAHVVVVGEVEAAMGELLQAVECRAEGLILRDHELADMGTSPAPRLDLVNLADYSQMGIQTTRGCPFLCDFCDVTLMNGRRARTKTPEQVIQELEAFYAAGWRSEIMFVDDIFNGNPGRARELARAVRNWQQAHGFPFRFRTQCSVTLAKNPELAETMVQAGFVEVLLGIETPDHGALEIMRKFQNSRCDLTAACDSISIAGLTILGSAILGLDGEEAGAGQRTLEFFDRTRIPFLGACLLGASPGTDLWKRLEREDRHPVRPSLRKGEVECSFLNFQPSRPAREIAAEYVDLVEDFYRPEAFLDRLLAHIERMAPNPETWPMRAVTQAERGAIAHVISDRGALTGRSRDARSRIRKALRDHPTRSDHMIRNLIRYESLVHFAGGIRADVERRMIFREQYLGERPRESSQSGSISV